VVAIGVTVAIVHSSRELINEVRKIIHDIKELVKEYREMKRVWVEVGPDRVPLDKLTEDHYRELANI
jgi:nicotinate-nucleotide pyrophosphorylase